jgi:hypothetical protein
LAICCCDWCNCLPYDFTLLHLNFEKSYFVSWFNNAGDKSTRTVRNV